VTIMARNEALGAGCLQGKQHQELVRGRSPRHRGVAWAGVTMRNTSTADNSSLLKAFLLKELCSSQPFQNSVLWASTSYMPERLEQGRSPSRHHKYKLELPLIIRKAQQQHQVVLFLREFLTCMETVPLI
jgi:hypothetical protein